jgi:hypothetical protein
MSMQLVVVDTIQIQPYIYGSNRLRENIGASHLVAEATGAWALEAVRAAVQDAHNIRPDGTLDSNWHIEERRGLAAEVLYTGGGNFVVLFADGDPLAQYARAFTAELSRKVLQEAPNLQLVIAQHPFDWDRDSLFETMNTAKLTLDRQKRTRAWSAPLLGLGVTAMCQSTGLPATGVTPSIGNDPGYLASDEILAKIDAATRHGKQPSAADDRLQRLMPIPASQASLYAYPADFEDLGGTPGEYSHIAVVHADGNAMGRRIQAIGDEHPAPADNRAYIEAIRQFSDAVAAASESALETVLAALLALPCPTEDGYCIIHMPHEQELVRIRLAATKDNRWFLPFRPLVFGGDDLTFVCDGRLGLALSVAYLRAFEYETARRSACRGRITSAAGIAIVKSHYPFAQAYELAYALSKQAKGYRKNNGEGSYLDWHFALSGLGGRLDNIRDREYAVPAGALHLRPVSLATNPRDPQRAWPVVEQGIAAFQAPSWADRRNKIKALHEALRGGAEAVKQFLIAFNENQLLPDIAPDLKTLPATGWHGHYCGYFDAIELVDWFVPLKGESLDASATASVPGA